MKTLATRASALALLVSACPAIAQEAAARTTSVLEEVVVQARRVDESLQEVPVAITALSGESLRRAAISTTQDLTVKVPSLQITPSTGRRDTVTFGIRSQVNVQPRLDSDPSVGVYFAEVNISRPFGLNQGLCDLASVQVLKGPQGTLFGRNSTGGAVLFQPNRPTLESLEGSVELEYGNYDHRVATSVVNVPVTSEMAIRIAGRIARRDGYTDNLFTGDDLDDVHNRSFRIAVLMQPTDAVENLFIYDDYKSDENGSATFRDSARPCPEGLASCLFPATQQAVQDQRARDIHDVALNGNIFSRVRNRGVSNITTFSLGSDISFKNIIGWRDTELESAGDYDGSPLPLLNTFQNVDVEQITVEPQLSLTMLDDALDLIIGAYYYREKGEDDAPIFALGPIIARPFAGGPVRNEAKSVFAQGNYRFPNLPDLRFTLGARYTWDDRSVGIESFNQNGTCVFAGDTPPCEVSASAEFNAPSWTVGLDYKIAPETLVYIASRRGYRAGGLGITATNEATLRPYESEEITDVELGLKNDARIAGMPLRTNIAAYYAKGDELQRFVFVGEAAAPATINAASAHFYGVEVEGTLQPVEGLTLSLFYNYDKGVYDDFEIDAAMGGTVDVSDSRFPYTPEHKFGATMRYEIPVAPGGDVAFQLDYYTQGTVYVNAVGSLEREARSTVTSCSTAVSNGTTSVGTQSTSRCSGAICSMKSTLSAATVFNATSVSRLSRPVSRACTGSSCATTSVIDTPTRLPAPA